ncbi:MAG: hypothetical protein D6718_01445, partial [Acidobacteria bacterium]
MHPTFGRKPWIVLAVLAVVASSWPAAQAIPAFARKYDLSCTACHSAWPTLNDYGRKFKENGYRLEPGTAAPDAMKKVDDNLFLEAGNFLTGRIKGYLYDKKDTSDRWKLEPGHEVELMLAGNAGNDFSFWVEAEAEDETDFNVALETVVGGWHPRQEVNIVGGTGSLFWADPYQTLADGGRRMTRDHKAPLDAGFVIGEKLRKGTPFVTLYGRKSGFFYSATIASGTKDPMGADEKDAAIRLAYDFPWFTIGGFYLDGSRGGDTFSYLWDSNGDGSINILDDVGSGNSATAVDYSRTGIDFQVEQGNLYIQGLYLKAKDDVYDPADDVISGDQSNAAYYIQGFYV